MRHFSGFLACLLLVFSQATAQVKHAPDRQEGEGPFPQLIIRGAILVDGTGSPPFGPVDIVIEGNRITDIVNAGYPGVQPDPDRRPKLKPGGHEVDASGHYVLPGFIDMHGHIGGRAQGADAEYVYKLWMAHGITTIREPSAGNGLDWTLEEKKRSAENKITAPRILAYTVFGAGREDPIKTGDEARAWVQQNAKNGADGIKFFGASPEVMEAALTENKRLGLRSACHHAQLDVARWNVVNSATAGLTSMEHWYGLPEALFENRTIQDYPPGYNYMNGWTSLSTLHSTFTRPIATCTGPGGRNGMRIIPCPSYGCSSSPVAFRMVRTGITGAPSRKSIGGRITSCG